MKNQLTEIRKQISLDEICQAQNLLKCLNDGSIGDERIKSLIEKIKSFVKEWESAVFMRDLAQEKDGKTRNTDFKYMILHQDQYNSNSDQDKIAQNLFNKYSAEKTLILDYIDNVIAFGAKIENFLLNTGTGQITLAAGILTIIWNSIQIVSYAFLLS